MAERDDSQERTEQATPRKLEQAREKGQVARSRELNTMGVVLAGAVALLAFGPAMVEGLGDLLRWGFTQPAAAMADVPSLMATLRRAAWESVKLLAPLFLVVLAVALLVPMLLGGWSFAPANMGFKGERLSPIKGLKRVFGPVGLVELAKALLKFLTVAGLAVLLLWLDAASVLGLGRSSLEGAMADAGYLLSLYFLALCGALVLIAAVDVPFQLWQHARQLRMTRQEIRDEYKETEGRPEVKSRIRNLQREVAQRRMMQEVPKADVVVTNPTHFAVALRYDAERMAAPRVVARGADLLALRLRQVAVEHGVPLLEAPPLARALYHSTRLDHEIPAGLYVAVAQVLAYVYQLRRGVGETPPPPVDLPIPEELQR